MLELTPLPPSLTKRGGVKEDIKPLSYEERGSERRHKPLLRESPPGLPEHRVGGDGGFALSAEAMRRQGVSWTRRLYTSLREVGDLTEEADIVCDS